MLFSLPTPFFRLAMLGALLLLSPFLHAEHEGKIQILLIGDSTTEGSIPRIIQPEGPHLEKMMTLLFAADADLPPINVINVGQSGETAHRLIDSGRYDKHVKNVPGVDYILLRYGINDYFKRKPVAENFPKDMNVVIAKLREDHPKALIIPMTSIPFMDDEKTAIVNDLVRAIAKEEGLDVFDIFPAYRKALDKGFNMLNYRRYSLGKIPVEHHAWLKPRLHGDQVLVMANELDAIFGHLPGWTGDRHPNLAGYNVIAAESVKYLTPLLKARENATH